MVSNIHFVQVIRGSTRHCGMRTYSHEKYLISLDLRDFWYFFFVYRYGFLQSKSGHNRTSSDIIGHFLV